MVTRRRAFRPRRLGLPEQLAFMRAVWRNFDTRILGASLLSRGFLQPTPLNGRYRVRIEYRPGFLPKAFVEDPPLRSRSPEERIPHVYEGPRPCLYYPKTQEWRPDMRISDTILPWLLLWLFHYEIWLAGGDWYGGGIHPPEQPKPEPTGTSVSCQSR